MKRPNKVITNQDYLPTLLRLLGGAKKSVDLMPDKSLSGSFIRHLDNEIAEAEES